MLNVLLVLLVFLATSLPVLAASPDSTDSWGINAARFGSLSEALASPRSTDKTLIITTTMDCGSLIIPEDRAIEIKKGGRIRYSGKLVINGPFKAGLFQVLEQVGSGTVVFGPDTVEAVHVQWFGAKGNGVDCSAAIMRAVNAAAGEHPVTFAGGRYKFSVSLDQALNATEFRGLINSGTQFIPLDARHPNFIITYSGAWSNVLSWKFRHIEFVDPASRTCAGIWTQCAIDVEACKFTNLKYGIIGNAAEWSPISRSSFIDCRFAVYATTSNPSNDPMGIGTGGNGGNPSEWYFRNCWFHNCDTDYYEDQPDGTMDKGTTVLFDTCQFIGGRATIVILGGMGNVTFRKSWWEGRSGTETGISVRGRSIPSSIIYAEGPNVYIEDCVGMDVKNPIYVKTTRVLLPGSSAATTIYPTIIIERSGGVVTTSCFNFDPGVTSIYKDSTLYYGSGVDLGAFTYAEGITPLIPNDATNGSGVLFPLAALPVTRISSQTNGLKNLWDRGTCSANALAMYGPGTSSIASGDGFILNKYSALSSVPHGNGPHSDNIGITAGKTYAMTFAARQSTGVVKSIRILGAGGAPNQISNLALPGDGKWHFYGAIVGAATTSLMGDIQFLNNSGATLAWDMSAIQLVEFDTLAEATRFLKSGVYVDPVIL